MGYKFNPFTSQLDVTINDATTTTKGKIKLAGDLAGTASLPTVPGLALKAPLASPAFTGVPTAPTASAGTSTTQLATTAFVAGEVATGATPDATASVKGKLQLAGDLGGTAASPTTPTAVHKTGAETVAGTKTFTSPIQLTDANTLTISDQTTYRKIQSYGSRIISINPEGNNVAIGKTTASSALDVNGIVTATGFSGPDRGSQVFNVKSYGVIGDGVTDDRVAIQSVLTAVSSLGGGVVLFPKGTYLVATTSLTIPANVTLRGVGSSSILTTARTSTGRNGIVNILAQDNVVIEGLYFNVDGDGSAIVSKGHTNLKIRNNYFTGTSTDAAGIGMVCLNGIDATANMNDTEIYGNKFENISAASVTRTVNLYPRSGHTITGVSIHDNTWSNTRGPSVYVDNYDLISGVDVKNNRFLDILCGASTIYSPAVAFLGGLSNPGQLSEVEISGNYYKNTVSTNAYNGFAFVYCSQDVIISDNRMYGAFASGVTGPALAPGRVDNPIINFTVTGNTIVGFDAAWDADSMRNVECADNIVYECGHGFILGYQQQEYINIHHNVNYNSVNATYPAGIYFANATSKKCSVTDNIFIDDRKILPPTVLTTVQSGGSLTASTTYYYRVTALDTVGETLGSTEVSGLTTVSNKKILLTWKSVAGAHTYKIYRTTSSGTYTTPSLLATTIAADYTDDGTVSLSAGTVPATSTVASSNMIYAVEITGNASAADVVLRNNRFYLPNGTFTSFYHKELGSEVLPRIAHDNEYHDSTGIYIDQTFQPLDVDLSQIAALTPSNDDFIQRKGGVWTNRTVAQVSSDLGIVASINRSISVISTNTAAGSTTKTDYVYFVSGTTTLTLPTAVGNTNRYSVVNTGSNTVTIATTSSQTIDGSTTINIIPGQSVDLISDNANWSIF